MLFEQIQVGDIVLASRSLKYPSWRIADFYIQTPVERTTRKQFIVGGERFSKKDGRKIGGYGSVYPVTIERDQTNLYKFEVKKLDLYYKLDKLLDSFKKVKYADCEIGDLERLVKLLEEFR